jgi:hypothetical protein
MNRSRTLMLLGALVPAIVGAVVFADRSDRPAGSIQHVVGPELAVKAQEHCWFSAKSRLTRGKSSSSAVTSAGSMTEGRGDLILVTGASDSTVGDDRYYGCALYQYTPGSPVVVATKTSSSPLRPDALVPLGFTSEGKKQ